MANLKFIFNTAITTQYVLVALLALIYSLPILCIRRFQHRNNIFTLNVCLTTALSCLLWLPNSVSLLTGYSPTFIQAKCPWLSIVQVISDIAVPYSLVLVSFHRCSSIVYAQRSFFRTRRWIVMCFVGQWVIATLLSIPDLLHPRHVGFFSLVKHSS